MQSPIEYKVKGPDPGFGERFAILVVFSMVGVLTVGVVVAAWIYCPWLLILEGAILALCGWIAWRR